MVSSSDLFQSLFFWIWNSDLCCRERKGLHQVVSILVFLDMEFRLEESPLGNIATRKFQSLFFWIWNSDLWYEFEFPLPRGFQSLFFWIWNSDNRYQETTSLLSEVSILVFLDMEFRLDIQAFMLWFLLSFNPCFSGYGIQTCFRSYWCWVR